MVNMSYESIDQHNKAPAGKPVNANKLVWGQIFPDKRASVWGHILNRAVNLGGDVKMKAAPMSQNSLQDYINRGAKVIHITRDWDRIESSIRRWLTENPVVVGQIIRQAKRFEQFLPADASFTVEYSQLTEAPASIMRDVCEYAGIPFEVNMLDGVSYNCRRYRSKIFKNR